MRQRRPPSGVPSGLGLNQRADRSAAFGNPKNDTPREIDKGALLERCWAGGDGGETRSVDTIEDIAVLGALLVFSSLSLAVIVLMY